LCAQALVVRLLFEGIGQDVQGRAVRDGFDPVRLHSGHGPRVADRFTALRDDRQQLVVPADPECHRAVGVDLAVQEDRDAALVDSWRRIHR
jgi:hypothetical protein